MNILVVSDDHGIPGFEDAYKDAKRNYDSIDMVIHAGDTQKDDLSEYRKICGCDFYAVKGNNDYNDCPEDIIIKALDSVIFVTHGHRYGVYAGVERLYFAALQNGANVAIFGHTHRAFHEMGDSVELINPGSLTLPRGCREGSYAVLTVAEGKKIEVEHYYI